MARPSGEVKAERQLHLGRLGILVGGEMVGDCVE